MKLPATQRNLSMSAKYQIRIRVSAQKLTEKIILILFWNDVLFHDYDIITEK